MTSDPDILVWIQEWFFSQCNEAWEHSYGIKIDTLDNPGWSVLIDLHGTEFENRVMDSVVIERNDDDWINCTVAGNQFKGTGGPKQLGEILKLFKTWVEGTGT